MSKHTSLTENEQAFLNKIQSLVANDDVMTDYDELISQVANNHNGRFWYECAMILQQMEEGMKLDMRDNGRLHVAWHIFNRLLESNPNIPQVWEGRINVLNYILAGYSARIRALANVEGYQQKVAESISRSKFIKKELLITLDIAIEKFADNNDWFIFEKKEFLEHNG